MYKIIATAKFKKDLKVAEKRNLKLDLLFDVVDILSDGNTLPEKYKDHALQGDYEGFRECHIKPDWLLVYRLEKDKLILVLSRTGTHSDLF